MLNRSSIIYHWSIGQLISIFLHTLIDVYTSFYFILFLKNKNLCLTKLILISSTLNVLYKSKPMLYRCRARAPAWASSTTITETPPQPSSTPTSLLETAFLSSNFGTLYYPRETANTLLSVTSVFPHAYQHAPPRRRNPQLKQLI